MKIQESDQGYKRFYTFLTKKQKHLWRIDKAEGFGLGAIHCGEVARKVRISITEFVWISRP